MSAQTTISTIGCVAGCGVLNSLMHGLADRESVAELRA